ncbi:MAG: response regulator transcription factor [Elusimicrobia bacterium]|nr:response regulator transcription factor [Elusimicrobiota bacterium]
MRVIIRPMAHTILVVEDEEVTSNLLKEILERENYKVLLAPTAFRARGLLSKNSPDLIILDRRLPDQDGLELCKEIRQRDKGKGVPVLFLTAKKSIADKVTGLSLGGDDYLVKPFDAQELLARVEALLRRRISQEDAPAVLQSGDLKLDLTRIQAFLKGKPLKLWPKEFEILRALLEKKGRVLSREFLLQSVWGYEKELHITSKTVDVTMSRLRKKLGSFGDKIFFIKGYGYRLDE